MNSNIGFFMKRWRLLLETASMVVGIIRIYHIQRIHFMPSAYILAKTIVFLIIALLIMTKIEPPYDSFILVSFISYLFIYLIKLLHTMDMPFRIDEYTMDDVSLFLLKEAHERIGEQRQLRGEKSPTLQAHK